MKLEIRGLLMTWIDKLERKIGKYAPQRLIYIIIALYGTGFCIESVAPKLYSSYLCLDIEKVLQGQVWRIITFLMYPSRDSSSMFTSILIFLLTSYMYYWISIIIEEHWGSFKFDLYYICGVLVLVLGLIVLYVLTGISFIVSPIYLNLSLFMIYAMIYPNRMVLLFMIIPLKSKWIAIVDLLFFVVAIGKGIIYLPNLISKTASVSEMALGYYYTCEAIEALLALAVLGMFYVTLYVKKDSKAYNNTKRKASKRNMTVVEVKPKDIPRHRCEVCGRTDITNPELEFRYCSKCNGIHEYCEDHIYTHEHIK